MSFAITRAGTVAEVRQQVEDVAIQDPLGEPVKALIAAVLDNQGAPRVIVDASGHADPKTSASVSITIRPVWE